MEDRHRCFMEASKILLGHGRETLFYFNSPGPKKEKKEGKKEEMQPPSFPFYINIGSERFMLLRS